VNLQVIDSVAAIDAVRWNALVEPGNPFMRHEFLIALEETACIGAGLAWQPKFIVASEGQDYRGAVAAFERSDSYGEYIFDWAWANAYAEARLPYYPKITVAAPFTPASGRRLLLADQNDDITFKALVTGLEDSARDLHTSGIHLLCTTRSEQKQLSQLGYLPRLTNQYHWLNRGYQSFDDYLEVLRAHRRKEIKRERRKCAELGLEIRILTKSQIEARHIDAMYVFYAATYARKWGSPYLNRETYHALLRRMRDSLVLVMAFDQGREVAGSIAFHSADRLFGRYWGASGNFPFLHFELCFYSLIDYAIENKIQIFEAGAQGEHKFQRGFTAMPVYSSHKLFDSGGADAIGRYLRQERRATARALMAYRSHSPIKGDQPYIPELEDDG
jgi:predicted N-acyltransferase